MVRCGIVDCRLRKDVNNPDLTFHRLPTNKVERKKWLKLIGYNNLIFNTKTVYVCSIHFEESCFDRTLGVVTLHENALPSLHLSEDPYVSPVPPSTSNDLMSEERIKFHSALTGWGKKNGKYRFRVITRAILDAKERQRKLTADFLAGNWSD